MPTDHPDAPIADPDITIYHGDARHVLQTLEPESVHTVVTSPPFWMLRDYGTATWHGGNDPACDHVERWESKQGAEGSNTLGRDATHPNRDTLPPMPSAPLGRPVLYRDTCGRCGAQSVDQQIGLEATPDAWIAELLEVFRGVHRVLRADGTAWVEIGDTYVSYNANRGASSSMSATADVARPDAPRGLPGLRSKDMVLAPFRLALALQGDGWYVRSVVIWHRPNPMPESAKDRPTTAHTYVLLLSKQPRYFYDGWAIREPAANDPNAGGRQRRLRQTGQDLSFELREARVDSVAARPTGEKRRTVRPGVDTNGGGQEGSGTMRFPLDSANARTVWTIPPGGSDLPHYAMFPPELVRRCIAAGTSEKGCCPNCGAPWRRVIDRPEEWGDWRRGAVNPLNEQMVNRQPDGLSGEGFYSEWTPGVMKGWERTCTCMVYLEGSDGPELSIPKPMPCTVLDPFMGTGTVALVARQMGRRSVGVELSAEYLDLARARLAQLSLLA